MNYFKNIEELISENEATKKANNLRDNSNIPVSYTHLDVYKRQEMLRFDELISSHPLRLVVRIHQNVSLYYL